jgi:hypothetical protein
MKFSPTVLSFSIIVELRGHCYLPLPGYDGKRQRNEGIRIWRGPSRNPGQAWKVSGLGRVAQGHKGPSKDCCLPQRKTKLSILNKNCLISNKEFELNFIQLYIRWEKPPDQTVS